MSHKKILGLFILSLIGFGVGFFLTNSYDFSLCSANLETNTYDVSCHILFERIGNPLFYGMGALAAVFLVLLVMPQAFPAWKKFAMTKL